MTGYTMCSTMTRSTVLGPPCTSLGVEPVSAWAACSAACAEAFWKQRGAALQTGVNHKQNNSSAGPAPCALRPAPCALRPAPCAVDRSTGTGLHSPTHHGF